MQHVTSIKKPRVAYLGPPASFSHQAAQESFPGSAAADLQPLPSFASILSAIQASGPPTSQSANSLTQETYDFALLPVENSTNGGVVQVLDLLIQCGLGLASCRYPDVEVVAEHYLEVHHCLFVHPSVFKASNTVNHESPSSLDDRIAGLNITMLYTHPQVWGQCDNFLSKHFPTSKTERIDMSSTSAAAAFVAKNPPQNHTASDQKEAGTSSSTTDETTTPPVDTIAAISSSLAGVQNNLVCLTENIEDEPGKNTTRFLIIRNRKHHSHHSDLPACLQPPSPPSPPSNKPTTISYKSLITFTIPHSQPGSLAIALAVFGTHDFNLTAITTRPSREKNWHYVFFVECEEQRPHSSQQYSPSMTTEDSSTDSKLNHMFKNLARVTERTCLLGSWVDRIRHPVVTAV